MAHELGTSESHVEVFDRGGTRRVADVTHIMRLQYTRERDDISSALLTCQVKPGNRAQETLFRGLESGRHELVIHRGDERVWEGPITRLSFGRHEVGMEARDVMHYVYRTVLRSAWNNAYPNTAYTTERARTLLQAELARKEVTTATVPAINVLPYLDIRTTVGETSRTSRSTKSHQKTLWEDIDDMAARSGMDYTVVGRSIVIFDTHSDIGQTVPLHTEDFLSELVLSQYGMDLATYSAVTDGEGGWGAVGGDDPYYGLVEVLETVYEEEVTQATSGGEGTDPVTPEELVSQATRNSDSRWPTPTVVRVPDGAQLSPTAPVHFADLVPGVRVPLVIEMPYRSMSQMQKLDRVLVTQTPEQSDRVAVTLSPAPTTNPSGGTVAHS